MASTTPVDVPDSTQDQSTRMSDRASVLVVDDESHILTALGRGLKASGYNVLVARTGEDALAAAATTNPDVLLLDLRLPDVDGITVVERLRTWTEVPILMLSGIGLEDAKIRALDAGADDFVDKPFSLDEVRARIRALLRRPRPHSRPPVLRVDDLVIDLGRHVVERGHEPVHLTPIQWRILQSLAGQPGLLVGYNDLIGHVWGDRHGDEVRASLRAHMRTLRSQLGDDARAPRVIETVIGVGYRWVAC